MYFIDLPLTGVQFVLSIGIIYLVSILTRVMTNMVDKDDPFSNGYLLAMIVLFVETQRFLFKCIDLIFIANFEQ